jgi:HAD superfamily phosphoserine phosphatase-like hydrolase
MKISVFDIDGTLSDGFFIVEFPKMLCKRQAFIPAENDKIQEIYRVYLAHEPYEGKPYEYERFAWDLVNAFGRGIKGQLISKIKGLGSEYAAQSAARFSFTGDLIDLVKGKGYRPIAVSGSPYEVILPFSESLGIEANEVFATTYKHDGNNLFTGEVAQNCATDTEKKKITDRYFAEHNVDTSTSAGFGDSDHDLSFLERVGYPVAIKPNSKLAEVATRKKWLICRNDKEVLDDVCSYLEGPSKL